jgi:hypothetical protein|tara:strand:+ start:3279 stop:3470 length:192 start_codon:yes stop_codon:yes gene_type:complete
MACRTKTRTWWTVAEWLGSPIRVSTSLHGNIGVARFRSGIDAYEAAERLKEILQAAGIKKEMT